MTNVANWVQESCTTVGTGDLVLAPIINLASFASAIPSGEVWYSIEDGQNREAGIGTFNGLNTIQRTTIHSTLFLGQYDDQAPTAIPLSGSATVSCTFNAKAFNDLFAHTVDTTDPHDVQADQVTYDPTGDPNTSSTDVQDALFDVSTFLESVDTDLSTAESNIATLQSQVGTVFVSETAPVSPELNSVWVDPSVLKMFVYYNDGNTTQWIQV